MIYCLSVHHTGTWTTIGWLTEHQGVGGFLQEAHVNEIMEKGAGAYLHEIGPIQIKPKFSPTMVYHEHARLEQRKPTPSGYLGPAWWEFRMAPSQMVLIATQPTVIPIRDPLASLVNYQKWAERDGRADGGNFNPIVHLDHWCALAGSYHSIKKFGHCKFLCWDLPRGQGELTRDLVLIAKDLGLENNSPSEKWGDGRVINSAGDYPLKLAYSEGDLGALRKGIANHGYDALTNREPLLRPFLEELGYKNLCWWSG